MVDAALSCIARWGVSKTTLEDIAREAGCSRATVYRLFPGGKQSLLEVASAHEIGRLIDVVAGPLADADDLADALTEALVAAATALESHEALRTIIAHEPELLLSVLSFDRLDPVLAVASAQLAPLLTRFVDQRTAAEVVEWCVRLLLSFTFEPSERIRLSARGDVQHLVSSHLLPGIRRAEAELPALQGAH